MRSYGISGNGSLLSVSFQFRDDCATPLALLLEPDQISDTGHSEHVFHAELGVVDRTPPAKSELSKTCAEDKPLNCRPARWSDYSQATDC